jgi:RNA polymerase sigma-70 factor, ECF subfamily
MIAASPHSSLTGYADPTTWLDTRLQSEQRLIHRAQTGDLSAFNDLVLNHQDQVYRQALWILGEPEAAEDAAQESFIRAYRSLDHYNGMSFRAWILRITTNYCYDQLRRRKTHPSLPLETFSAEENEEIECPAWLRDPHATPEQALEQAEAFSTIRKCLMSLSPENRAVIVLVDIHEMDYQEAAAAIGVGMGTFKSRLFRARAHLREAIQKSQH